jgi:uncharacterized protein YukE
MASDDVTVAEEDLATSAAQANYQVNTTLTGILSTLGSKVAARGKPWGDDSYGSQFYDGGSGYGQVNAATMKNAGSLAEVFEQTGDTLKKAAKGMHVTEDVSSSSFNGK